jgi:hypothetical protein
VKVQGKTDAGRNEERFCVDFLGGIEAAYGTTFATPASGRIDGNRLDTGDKAGPRQAFDG